MSRPILAALAGLLLLPAASDGITQSKDNRGVKILGGAIAAPGQFPWMAVLVDSSARRAIDGGFCGGSVIAPRVILTAAHCVEGTRADEIDVVTGRTRMSVDTDGQRISVSKIVVHAGYDPDSVIKDVALLQLSSPTTATAVPIAHPEDDGLTTPGSRVMVMGWGATTEGGDMSDDLRYVRLTTRSHGYCDRVYGAIDDASQLCIGSSRAGEDSCQGDSGGPVVAGDGTALRLVGTVSYGEGCGRKGIPGVYTRVSKYASWIDSHAAALNGTVVPPPPPPAGGTPVVRIAGLTCGSIYCDVTLRTSGRAPAGGIVFNYIRRRSKGHKKIDEIAYAKQVSATKWVVHAPLPYGVVTMYAIPLNATQDDLDGEGDVERYEIY